MNSTIYISEVHAQARRALAAAPNGHLYPLAALCRKWVQATVWGVANLLGVQLTHLRFHFNGWKSENPVVAVRLDWTSVSIIKMHFVETSFPLNFPGLPAIELV